MFKHLRAANIGSIRHSGLLRRFLDPIWNLILKQLFKTVNFVLILSQKGIFRVFIDFGLIFDVFSSASIPQST